jgi:hypothetical protein
MYPASVPNSSQLPRKPRFLSGEYSAMKVDAPAYSPPVEKPWTRRAARSSSGAGRHHDHGHGEDFLAAHAVAQRAEDQAAEGADQEGRSEGAERRQELGGRIAGREEDLAQGDGDVAVDAEVEPLHGVAQRGGLHGTLHEGRVDGYGLGVAGVVRDGVREGGGTRQNFARLPFDGDKGKKRP